MLHPAGAAVTIPGAAQTGPEQPMKAAEATSWRACYAMLEWSHDLEHHMSTKRPGQERPECVQHKEEIVKALPQLTVVVGDIRCPTDELTGGPLSYRQRAIMALATTLGARVVKLSVAP